MDSGTKMYRKLRDYVDGIGASRKIIALNMGITESQLSLMLNGKRRITVEDYLLFCKAISVDPRKFIEAESA